VRPMAGGPGRAVKTVVGGGGAGAAGGGGMLALRDR
jgi:hypothetical protein